MISKSETQSIIMEELEKENKEPVKLKKDNIFKEFFTSIGLIIGGSIWVLVILVIIFIFVIISLAVVMWAFSIVF